MGIGNRSWPFFAACIIAILCISGCQKKSISWVVPVSKNLSFEDYKEYGLRKRYLVNKLTEIRKEVLSETGEGWRQKILDAFDESIRENKSAVMDDELKRYRQKVVSFNAIEPIHFYKPDIEHDFDMNDNYLTHAQGQIWACITPGLYFTLIDPYLEQLSKMFSVRIPQRSYNTLIIRIPIKFGDTQVGWENSPCNVAVCDNALKYVYKFFDGVISPEQFEAVMDEVVVMGYEDVPGSETFKKFEPPTNDKEKYAMQALYVRRAIANEYPKTEIKREFGGKTYTFRYSVNGSLMVEFLLDD